MNKKLSRTFAKETNILLGSSEWKLVSLLNQPLIEEEHQKLFEVGVRDERVGKCGVLLDINSEDETLEDRKARFDHLIS